MPCNYFEGKHQNDFFFDVEAIFLCETNKTLNFD